MRGITDLCIRLISLVLLHAWILPTAIAVDRTPYRASLVASGIEPLLISASSAGDEREAIPTVRVTGRIFGEGMIDAHFSVRRHKTWEASVERNGVQVADSVVPVLLQGSMAVGGGWRRHSRRVTPVAASIIQGQVRVTFAGRVRGTARSRQRIYTVRFNLDGTISVSARIGSIPARILQRGACGAPESHMHAAAVSQHVPHIAALTDGSGDGSQLPVAQGVTYRVVTISTDADQEWYARYGDASNAMIASFINAAELIYERQLGVRFRIVRQHVYTTTSPYTTTEPGGLLTAFTKNGENSSNMGVAPESFDQDVDVKHLFTGKDMDGSVVGIAYIGALCKIPSLSYGVTQAYSDAAVAGIFAHELGHTFGAYHDIVNRDSIMYPSISIPPSQFFSDVSLGEMVSQLTTYNQCVSYEELEPRTDSPTPQIPVPTPPSAPDPRFDGASIYLLKRRVGAQSPGVVLLYGRLKDSYGFGMYDETVRMFSGETEIGSTTTDYDGRYTFYVRPVLPEGATLPFVVQTQEGEVSSNEVSIRRRPTQRSVGQRAR
jgi:hypothetical protein